MARSKIQTRQEAERERIARYDAVLKQPRAVDAPQPHHILREVRRGLEDRVLRDPELWQPKLKSKDPAKIALAAARYLFAAYPVPAHLERVWFGELPDRQEALRRKRWYIAVAQGASLFKTCAQGILSKRETHRFLNPPVPLDFVGATWFAVASSYTEDLGLALRIARSKIARPTVPAFWREAARFFCGNPLPLNELDDLCDYIGARHDADGAYGLKGRTLASLRGQMAAWHRELARLREIGDGRWEGAALSDWSWTVKHETQPHRDLTWTVSQIRTGRELAEEGNRMHHCVYTYKRGCMSGHCSIWSVKVRSWAGVERKLTLEMNALRRIVQIRGFANRSAHPEELAVLRRWATARGVGGV